MKLFELFVKNENNGKWALELTEGYSLKIYFDIYLFRHYSKKNNVFKFKKPEASASFRENPDLAGTSLK